MKFGLLAWLLLLGSTILVRILSGEINNTGLFQSSISTSGHTLNPERVQSVVVVGIVLAGYLLEIWQTGTVENEAGEYSLPDVPQSLITLIGGSNGLYLAGKIFRTN